MTEPEDRQRDRYSLLIAFHRSRIPTSQEATSHLIKYKVIPVTKHHTRHVRLRGGKAPRILNLGVR